MLYKIFEKITPQFSFLLKVFFGLYVMFSQLLMSPFRSKKISNFHILHYAYIYEKLCYKNTFAVFVSNIGLIFFICVCFYSIFLILDSLCQTVKNNIMESKWFFLALFKKINPTSNGLAVFIFFFKFYQTVNMFHINLKHGKVPKFNFFHK